jgi:hypothetical protein
VVGLGVVVVGGGDVCACAGTTTDVTTGRTHCSGKANAPKVPPPRASCSTRRRSTVTRTYPATVKMPRLPPNSGRSCISPTAAT